MGQSSIVHNFNERLNFSERASDELFWLEIYKKAFPNMVNAMPCPGDTISQRAGIDRVILLSSGKLITIDEKKREEVWDDILLEYVSVDTNGTPGWIEKDLIIDYLAYAFMPNKTVYLLPWDLLRRAWLFYKPSWMAKYKKVSAQNNGYKTLSLAIPIAVLLNSIKTASIITLPEE